MILPIEQQFAAPELCERLVELGAPVGADFAWGRTIIATGPCEWGIMRSTGRLPYRGTAVSDGVKFEYVPAYSNSELGELLKPYGRDPHAWWNGEEWRWVDPLSRCGRADSEVDARALVLICMAETSQIDFSDAVPQWRAGDYKRVFEGAPNA